MEVLPVQTGKVLSPPADAFSAVKVAAVNIQKNIIGRKALNYLLERLQNPKLSTRSTVVEPYLVMRDSVQDR